MQFSKQSIKQMKIFKVFNFDWSEPRSGLRLQLLDSGVTISFHFKMFIPRCCYGKGSLFLSLSSFILFAGWDYGVVPMLPSFASLINSGVIFKKL